MNPQAFRIQEPYYLIIDLEATCSENMSLFPRDEMEIIEIGAVMLATDALSIAGEFQTFVKPLLHSQLTPFCQQLTTITQDLVEAAPEFPEALKAFQNWFESFGTSRFCSWGDYDRNQFERDCHRHGLGYPFGSHLNLKWACSEALGLSRRMGMVQALERLGLPLQGTLHRGIDDARNMARMVQHIMEHDDVTQL
ncbi:MAG: exonuclease [Candidatus Melainabacteria bacterium HGW-Melainabacteria-1]|nr:MAG: exonuclease [Candidatus Melainabacteria bacterium HGW-Melainabacteria-1]